MHSFFRTIKFAALMLAPMGQLGVPSYGGDLNESEQLAVVKKWLPNHHSNLQLVFEYDSTNSNRVVPTSEQLHKAVDRTGPTVVIVQAQTAYEETARTIGGYNPYKWKTWLGHYESNAGRFIFSIDKDQKWERTRKRIGSFKASTSEYELCFGDGDLIINADLASGSAKNSTFASSSKGSVLIGQAGDFLVRSMRVYRIMDEKTPSAAPIPLQRLQVDYVSPLPSPVPDSTHGLLEIPLLIALFAIARRFFKKTDQ